MKNYLFKFILTSQSFFKKRFHLALLLLGTLTSMITIGQGCAKSFKVAAIAPEQANVTSLPSMGSTFPPTITQHPQSKTVNLGSSVIFEVVASGSGQQTYKWYFNGSQIMNANSAQLILSDVQASQEGAYTVLITNNYGFIASDIASLKVNLPPSIVSLPTAQTVTAGVDLRFAVAANGTPPLAYQWYKDNVAIAGATNATLSISASKTSDSGSYSISVTNMAGSVKSSSFNVAVSNPVNNNISPSITQQPVSLTVNAGGSAAFTVIANGTAPLSYQWKFNNISISGANSPSYSIPTVNISNQGAYTVDVTNPFGNASSVPAILTVNSPVVITQQPMSQTVNSGTAVTLSVAATGTAPISYQWQKNGVDIVGATDSTFKLSSSLGSDSGDYSVTLKNIVNTVKSNSATLKVNILPGTFSQAYSIVQAKCNICHNPSGQASFAVFSNFTTEAQFFASTWFKPGDAMAPAIRRMKGSGDASATMPLGNTAWSQAEFETVSSWLLAGMAPVIPPPAPSFDATFACNAATAGDSPSQIKRLSKKEFTNAVADFISRLPAASQSTVLSNLQPKFDLWLEDNAIPFSRWDNQVTQSHADSVLDVAMSLATAVVANTAYMNAMISDSVCGANATKASLTGACLQSFINYYGRKAHRRPITTSELSDYTKYFSSFTGDDQIVSLLARFIAHPRFLYRLDIGENTTLGGSKVSGVDGVDAIYNLDKYELLSKLSFLYWAAPPDDTLYNQVAAASFDLNNETNLNAVLATLLASPKAKTGLTQFFYEWLQLGKTPQFDTPSAAFKTLTTGENIGVAGHDYKQDMINEVLEMASYYTITTSGRYEDLLNSPYSFTKSSDLAKIYGVGVWDGSATNLVKFPDTSVRSGLLTRAAMIASAGEYTRPIIKGKKIRSALLCDEIPPPPPDLIIKPLVQDTMTTTLKVVERTTADAKCMACHSQMNYIGFTTENFDSLGRFRSSEKKFNADGTLASQLPIVTSTPANIFSGDTKLVNNAVDLSSYIAETGKGHQCFVKQVFRYSVGRMENINQDGCSLENMRLKLMPTGGSMFQLLKEVSKQPQFKRRKVM